MDRLDLRLAEYFITVAEELHFGRAATRLHIAQPSLSQQIRKLEGQLGVQLLERDSRHVELTAAGATLLREARAALAQAERAVHATRDAPNERLVIGFYGSAASSLINDILDEFAQRAPSVEIALRELELSHTDEIADGRVDIGFTRLRTGETGLAVEELLAEPRVVVVPRSHRLASHESLALTDLRAESFITGPKEHNPGWRTQWLAEQHEHGLPGRIGVEASSVQEILTLVATRRGVCLVPATAAKLYPRPDVAYIPVRDAQPAIVSLAWSSDRLSASGHEFLAVARHVAHRITTAQPA